MIEITGLPDHPLQFMAMALAAGFAAAVLLKLVLFITAQKTAPFRAGEAMNAVRAEVVDWSDGAGYVNADGELWRAVSKSRLAPGDEVRIKSVNGLTLQVMRKQA
ncbi:MAG: NfeD family protein [Parvularculaceae bacterium]